MSKLWEYVYKSRIDYEFWLSALVRLNRADRLWAESELRERILCHIRRAVVRHARAVRLYADVTEDRIKTYRLMGSSTCPSKKTSAATSA